jgi:hypothetical protein
MVRPSLTESQQNIHEMSFKIKNPKKYPAIQTKQLIEIFFWFLSIIFVWFPKLGVVCFTGQFLPVK